MASQQRFPKNGKSPLKYWWVPLEVQSFKPNLIVLNENLSAPPTSCPKEGLRPERRENNRLTVSHVRSAVAGIWDRVGQPAIFLSKNIFKCDNIYSKHVLFQVDSDRYVQTVYEDTKSFGKDAEVSSRYKSPANSSFEDLHGIKKMLLFASCNRNVNSFYFQRTAASAEENNIANKFSNGIDGNMIPKPFSGIKDLANFTKTGFHTLDESCTIGKTTSNLPDSQNIQNFGKSVATDLVTNTSGSIKYEQNLGCSMSSPHDLQSSTCTREETEILRQPISECKNSCDVDFISSVVESHDCQNLINTTDVVLKPSKENSAANYQNTNKNEKFFGSLSLVENFPQQQWLAIQNNLQHTFSNNRHAIAGALAGTLVTLCLHPVDTVKTIIQANATGQKSFYRIVRRIISQHGILGLYRGIASNITSSAPISAIYTFTYESVKCTLLPLLPKEYHSLAHCIAGGCSSVATSFVFTPSERIKQQMQVGSQYQNCWKALIGCLQKGGIPSLYAGWGAVLCRNIPHSIIKFYTYESLKQFFSSAYPDSSFQTFHTLICGGLAGSTAALFTTPFDVVKTRLQTQPPGSIGKYHGVFHALQEIARQEGLPGLYRGLAPRLAMYVSQGAIFFVSYEFLKAIFLSEASQSTSKMKEDEMSSDSPAAAVLQKQPA